MTTSYSSTVTTDNRAEVVSLLRQAVLVIATAVLLAVLSNVLIPLPYTPVPMSLATFGVLAAAGTLGPVRAGLSTGLFLLAGVAGVPWFAAQGSGWGTPTLGYVVGYVLAAVVVGHIVRSSTEERALPILGAMLLGTLLIYATGVSWLMLSLETSASTAMQLGVVPFLVGDLLKVMAATVLIHKGERLQR